MNRLIALTAYTTFGLCATAAIAAEPATALPAGAVATVNQQPVQRSVLDVLAASRQDTSDRRALLDDLVLTELISQRARASGIDTQAQVKAELALSHKRMLGQRLLQQLAAEMKVDEAELQARYRALEADTSLTTDHILVADEASARRVISQLDAGSTFAELARKLSIDPETRDSGGQLGALNASQLAPPYASAAKALKPGSYTRVAVQTEFGWHVIRLRAMRTLPKPAYEALRGSLRSQVVNERLEAQLAQWRKEAKLTVLQTP